MIMKIDNPSLAIRVPVLPNSPLKSRHDCSGTGSLKLRRNVELDFIENAAFDPALLGYDEDYQNSQAHSTAFHAHMTEVLATLKSHLPRGSRIVEVGCGKGDFLELVQSDGYFRITGYDAAYDGDNTSISKRYLTEADRIDADLIVLRHVLEHIPQPHIFLEMLGRIFGIAKLYVEVPNYDWIVDHEAFFDITYEHVNYFSRRSLGALFNHKLIAQGLNFGDQYLYVLSRVDLISPAFRRSYESAPWQDIDFFALFPNLSQTITEMEGLVAVGRAAYIWGAATKGCMFLVHCAHQDRLVDQIAFAIDINPKKVGKFLPISLVEIKSKEDFFDAARDGDVLIISNPNYEAEIVEEVRRAVSKNIKIICL